MNYAPSEHFRNHARALSGGNDFVSELNEAIKQNPLPAALIGVGVLWMFMGGAKNTVLGGASRPVFRGLGYGAQQAGGAISSGVGRMADTITEAGSQAAGGLRQTSTSVVGESASHVSEAAKAAYDAAGSTVSSAGHAISEAASTGSQAVAARGSEMGTGLQQMLADAFAKQPLLLGAVGLAVGAVFAASMPTTAVENQMMGDTAASFKGKTEELWSEATKRAEAMASRGLDEAKAQGLTPEAAGEALRGMTDKAFGIAEKAKDGLVNRVTNNIS